MEGIDLRKYPRTSVDIPVTYRLNSVTYRTRAISLGGGGAFLALTQAVAPDTEVNLQFRPARHLRTIETRAKVRRQLACEGVGVEFAEIRPQDRRAVLRLILHRVRARSTYPCKRYVVQAECGGRTFLGLMREMSVGGMFIETNEAISEGSKMRLRFHLDSCGSAVIATTEVRYTIDRLGLGVGFLAVSSTDRSRIETFVAQAGGSNFVNAPTVAA
jgi:c-di-GMP-binding flagellar brake protein YcgR